MAATRAPTKSSAKEAASLLQLQSSPRGWCCPLRIFLVCANGAAGAGGMPAAADETVCSFCGMSHLMYSETKKLEAESGRRQRRVDQLEEHIVTLGHEVPPAPASSTLSKQASKVKAAAKLAAAAAPEAPAADTKAALQRVDQLEKHIAALGLAVPPAVSKGGAYAMEREREREREREMNG